MKLTSEEKLLVSSAPNAGPDRVAESAGLVGNGSVSWDKVSKLAHWHRVPGLLFTFLRDSLPGAGVPQSELDHLRSHYRHTTVRSMHIRAEFTKAAHALREAGIEFVALKGIVLLDSVYRDPGTREMTDIDLLVRVEDADRAQGIVRGLGYEPVGSEVMQERTRQFHRHLPKLHNHDRELSFEVHTHLISMESPLRFDIETVWKHARTARVQDLDVLVPAPEHMLLHLCLHFFLDRRFTSGSSIRHLGDIAGFVGAPGQEMDWDFFVDQAREYNLGGAVFSVLSIASKLMEANVPEKVLDSLKPADYSQKMELLFIKQRVLQTNTLTATELVPHQAEYSTGALVKGVLKRMSPNRVYMETHYGDEAIISSRRTRLMRLGEMMQRTFGYLLNPLRLWQEFKVDRWLHSLSSGAVDHGDGKPGVQ